MKSLNAGNPDQAAPLVGMIAIVAGALGLYFWVEPLRTFRPNGQEEPRPPLEVKLPSRLWQDPLLQARESVARTPSGPVQGQVPRIPDLELRRDARVLAVTIAGGYGQQDHETRLRSRYAVELALGEQGYAPAGEDTEFLRFLLVTWRGGDDQITVKAVPFEWWEGSPAGRRGGQQQNPFHVLVLWIDDSLLGSSPRQSLRKFAGLAGIPPKAVEDLRLIGPTASSGLKDLVAEEGSSAWPSHIYSPWATADEVFLFGDDFSVEDMRLPATIERTIATDRQACGRLIEEMKAREIRFRSPSEETPDTIALLSEFDTVYGRALPMTFAACVLTQAKGRNCANNEGAIEFRKEVRNLQKGENWPAEVLRMAYLRGLDGVGPRSPGQEKDQNTKAKPSLADMERPDGTSQLDYARRLADKLTRTRSSSLRAVGVLGGDIYDKLLLLQALRERLPGVFFTTDLDAAYLHPSQNAWSRNLLVASSFGLSEDRWKGPPLRDTYGVAIHRAVSLAISSSSNGRQPLNPSIYEIGRTAAHRLGPEGSEGTESPEQRMMARDILWMLLLMLLTGVLLTMHFGREAIWGWLAILAVLAVILAMLAAGKRDEPILWLEGISVWPTEVIRLLSAAGAAVVLLRVGKAMQQNFDELKGTCRFAGQTTEKAPWNFRWWRAWKQLLAEAPTPDAQGQVQAQSLWNCYGRAEEAEARWWRTGTLAGALMTVAGVSLYLERPMRPCRGMSCGIDLMAAVVSIIALLILTCYVADATATCTRWIRCMSVVKIIWTDSGEASAADMPGPWHEVEVVARRTQVVGQLILYPFALLLLLIVARFPVFDRWPWPVSLLITFALLLGVTLISALALRSCAEQLRTKSYAEVRALWAKATREGAREQAQLHETAMKSIAEESRGAFSPLTHNPVLTALLLPLGGAGTGLALEKLLQNL